MNKDENLNKVFRNNNNNTSIFNDFLSQIVAHISNENEGEKKQFTGKKKIVKPDQNENKKPEGNESEDKKPKEKESPVTGQWMKNLEMLNLRSLDEF